MYPESAVWTSWFGIGFQYKAWIAALARDKNPALDPGKQVSLYLFRNHMQ